MRHTLHTILHSVLALLFASNRHRWALSGCLPFPYSSTLCERCANGCKCHADGVAVVLLPNEYLFHSFYSQFVLAYCKSNVQITVLLSSLSDSHIFFYFYLVRSLHFCHRFRFYFFAFVEFQFDFNCMPFEIRSGQVAYNRRNTTGQRRCDCESPPLYSFVKHI